MKTTLEIWQDEYKSYGESRSRYVGTVYQLSRLFGGAKLRDYERVILTSIGDALTGEAAAIYQTQLEQLNVFSHMVKGQYCGIDRVIGMKPRSFDNMPRLGFNSSYYRPWARAIIEYPLENGASKSRVDLYLKDGILNQIMFVKRPQEIFGTRRPDTNKMKVDEIDFMFDAMDPDPFGLIRTHDTSCLPDWLSGFISHSAAVNISSPLSEPVRRKILDYLDLSFPEDYLELVARTDFFRLKYVLEVYGLSNLFHYMTPHEHVVRMAEIEGEGSLCMLRGRKPGLYFIDNNWDHIPSFVGYSFRDAVCKALTEGVEDWIKDDYDDEDN